MNLYTMQNVNNKQYDMTRKCKHFRMEIIGSDTFTYMIYDKELLYIIVKFDMEYKNGSDSKMCKFTFFS